MRITLVGMAVVVAVVIVVAFYMRANQAQPRGTDQPDGANQQ